MPIKYWSRYKVRNRRQRLDKYLNCGQDQVQSGPNISTLERKCVRVFVCACVHGSQQKEKQSVYPVRPSTKTRLQIGSPFKRVKMRVLWH